jgi:hypothetical protein
MELGRVVMVDNPHFPFALSIFQENEHRPQIYDVSL